jgi:type II secretory pathway component PulJ
MFVNALVLFVIVLFAIFGFLYLIIEISNALDRRQRRINILKRLDYLEKEQTRRELNESEQKELEMLLKIFDEEF